MKDLPDICLEIENSLPLWVGGDLESEGQRAVEEHLARCVRCAERGAKVRRARSALLEGLRLVLENTGAGLDPWPRIRTQLMSEGILQGHSRTRSPSAPKLAADPSRASASSRLRRIFLAGSLAAAVLVGLRLAWNRIPEDVPEIRTPILSEREATGSANPKDDAAQMVSGAAVVKPAGLRRLSPNERRLRESARVFGVPDDRMGSQASFERAIESPPR